MQAFFLYASLYVSLLLSLVACKNEQPAPEGTFTLHLSPQIEQTDFQLGQVYQNPAGRRFQVDALRLYLSDITLISATGAEHMLSNDARPEGVLLYDLGEPSSMKYSFQVPAGEYQGIRFSLGVPKNINHLDPTDFPTTHPLSEFRGMHWSWNSGYIFFRIDGQVDSSQGQNAAPDLSLTYHLGMDTLLRTVSFTEAEQAFTLSADQAVDMVLELGINQLFIRNAAPLDMVDQHLSHTSDNFPLALYLMDNLQSQALRPRPL